MRLAPARLAALLLLLAATGTACSSASADEPKLLNELATRLDRAGDLTFTAEYRLSGGAQAVIAQAQQPRRAAYVHPGGKAVFTESELATCRMVGAANRCTITAPPSPGTDPALDLLTATTDGSGPSAAPSPADAGLVAPSQALRLVSDAVLNGATVTRYEGSIAGERATCVGVHGAEGFTACVTAEGLLGSFTGTIEGRVVSFELTSYSDTADAATSTSRQAPKSTTAAPADSAILELRARPPSPDIPRSRGPISVRKWRGGGDAYESIRSCQSRSGVPDGRARAIAATSV
jgi:hypothetical protein